LNKIIVIIPAFNEENTIAEVISKTAKILKNNNYTFEIIVIDDGSTDNTYKKAIQAGSNVVEHHANLGLAEAVKTGLNEAIQKEADIIINIDADGQYDPKEIPLLVDPIINDKADIVLGSRFLGKIESMPFIKYWGNRIFTYLMRLITRYPFTDTQTGYRALSINAAKTFVLKSGYTYTQEMLIQAVESQLRIIELPIMFYKRKHGNSRLIFNPLSYAIKVLPIIFITYSNYHPFQLRSRIFEILSNLLNKFNS
jgi:glycosyltransferase involved in cell wall biosynthesis